MHTTRTSRLGAVVCAGGLLATAGCSASSPSYVALAKIARAVPTPPGLTYVREVDHVQHAAFGGRDQKQVAVIYANSTMSCEALSAAWRAVVVKEHWQIAKNSSADLGAFYLSKKGIPITVDPGGSTGTCPDPEVSVGKTG